MRKILIVDDEDTLLKNVGEFLTVKGYRVFTSLAGDMGLELLRNEGPDLLVLDLHLKEGPSGMEVLRQAKTIKPDIKIIMFTGFANEDEVKEKCRTWGANTILTKPTSLKDLTEAVEDLLGGA